MSGFCSPKHTFLAGALCFPPTKRDDTPSEALCPAAEDMEALESALSMLLGAAMSCRAHPPDATTLRVVRSALDPMLETPLRVETQASSLCVRGVTVADPDPNHGLCARLRSEGWEGLEFRAGLQDQDLLHLLSWMHNPAVDIANVHFAGLRLLRTSRHRSAKELDVAVGALGLDPHTGLDLLVVAEAPATAAEIDQRLREAIDALRSRVGRARMVAAESQLRKACASEAISEAAQALSQGHPDISNPATGEAPLLSLDALKSLEDPS